MTATLHSTLQQLRSELKAKLGEVAQLEAAIAAIEKVTANTRPPPEAPGTSEAVQLVLLDSDEALTDLEILDELKRRGWGPASDDPLNALRASLSRLTSKTKRLVRTGKGTYDLAMRVDTTENDDIVDIDELLGTAKVQGDEELASGAPSAGYAYDEEPF
jgi:hypothetical protein